MSAERVDVYITPLEMEMDGAKVTLVGVVPYESVTGKRRYIVSCVVEWRGWRSRQFTLDVESNRELEQKLRVEIARMKVFIASGYTAPFMRVG